MSPYSPERRREDRGASAVEFALVSIPLVTLLLGMLTFGFPFFDQITVTQAARFGARQLAICTTDTTCQAGVKALIRGQAAGVTLTDGLISTTACPPNFGLTASATVTVDYPVQVLGPFGTITVHGKASTPCGG